MKKVFSVLLCVILTLCFSGCVYHPPEGWTRSHHTYREALAYARSIDPNATVSETYTDRLDEYDWKFREWDAVINGVDCHAASVSDWVWNDGLIAGEFAKVFYRIDTDYDYILLQNILAEKYPDWKTRDSIRSKYHQNTNTIFVDYIFSEYRMLSDDELAQLWQTAVEIHERYEQDAIGRKVGFTVRSPGIYWNQADKETYVKHDSHAYITEFTEEGKQAFIQEYHEDWALVDSGLPVRE